MMLKWTDKPIPILTSVYFAISSVYCGKSSVYSANSSIKQKIHTVIGMDQYSSSFHLINEYRKNCGKT